MRSRAYVMCVRMSCAYVMSYVMCVLLAIGVLLLSVLPLLFSTLSHLPFFNVLPLRITVILSLRLATAPALLRSSRLDCKRKRREYRRNAKGEMEERGEKGEKGETRRELQEQDQDGVMDCSEKECEGKGKEPGMRPRPLLEVESAVGPFPETETTARNHGFHSHGFHAHDVHTHSFHAHGLYSHGFHSHGFHPHGSSMHGRKKRARNHGLHFPQHISSAVDSKVDGRSQWLFLS